MIANILSIAGSDASGGAGIQADIKSISANGGFAMAAITALTAQNTCGVTGVELVEPAFVEKQIDTVFADIAVAGVKIGMIATADIAIAVARSLERNKAMCVVLDPVMVAKGGDRLLAEDAVQALATRLMPIADVITPNLPEAAALLGRTEIKAREDMPGLAAALQAMGARAVLLKGGHLETPDSPDYLLLADGTGVWFEGKRTKTKNTHGTGCTLSSALATRFAITHDLETATRQAKAYVAKAIAHADDLNVGKGHGPTHHFYDINR